MLKKIRAWLHKDCLKQSYEDKIGFLKHLNECEKRNQEVLDFTYKFKPVFQSLSRVYPDIQDIHKSVKRK